MARRYRPEKKFDVESDARRRQQGTLWHDAIRNGTSVDGFLWKGLPNATPIQRAGAIVWGIAFLICGFALLYMACERRFLPIVLIASIFAMAGWRVLSNGLPLRWRDKLRPLMILLPMLGLLAYSSWPVYNQ